MFAFWFLMFVFCFVYSVFWHCLCIVPSFVLSLSYFRTYIPTPAIGWKPNCSNDKAILLQAWTDRP